MDVQPGPSSELSGKEERGDKEEGVHRGGIDASRLTRLGLALEALFKVGRVSTRRKRGHYTPSQCCVDALGLKYCL